MAYYRATGDEGLLSLVVSTAIATVHGAKPASFCRKACMDLSRSGCATVTKIAVQSIAAAPALPKHSVLLNQCAMVGSLRAGWSLGVQRSSFFFVNPLHQIWTKFTPSRNSDFSVSLRVNTVHNCESNTRLTVVPSLHSNYKIRIHTLCCVETESQGS